MCSCVQEEEGTHDFSLWERNPMLRLKQQARDTVTPEKKALIQREQKNITKNQGGGQVVDNTQGGKQNT